MNSGRTKLFKGGGRPEKLIARLIFPENHPYSCAERAQYVGPVESREEGI